MSRYNAEHPYGGWINPKGELIPVIESCNHWGVAEDLLVAMGVDPDEEEHGGRYLSLFKRGWMRVAFDYYDDKRVHYVEYSPERSTRFTREWAETAEEVDVCRWNEEIIEWLNS